MTNETHSTENQSANEVAAKPANSPRRKWLIGGAVGLAALVGLGAVQAYSSPWGGGHRHGWHRTMDPAMMGKKVDFGVDLILGRVGANESQKTKVAGTIKNILSQAPEFRKSNLEARDQLIKLLKADSFDKAALEKLRVERIKALDEASKKVALALGEVADTLSPKQRKELIEFAEKRRRMFGRHGR